MQGQTGHKAFVLQAGWGCSYKLLPNVGRQVISFPIVGDCVGLRSVLLRTADHSFSALTDAVVTSMDGARILKCVTDFPRLGAALLWAASRDEAMVVEHLVSIGRRSASRDAALPQHGKVLVDHSTTEIEATGRLAAALTAATGMEFIDAPVSGGPGAAAAGTLAIMSVRLILAAIERTAHFFMELAERLSGALAWISGCARRSCRPGCAAQSPPPPCAGQAFGKHRRLRHAR